MLINIEIIANKKIYLENDELKVNDILLINYLVEFNVIVKLNNKIVESKGLFYHKKENRKNRYVRYTSWKSIYNHYIKNTNQSSYYKFITRDEKLKKLLKYEVKSI